MTRACPGFALVELLIATLLLAMASAGALATWSLSSRVPANKRVTEMGVYIATQEIERVKSLKYMPLEDSPLDANGERSPAVHYYDRYGASASAAAEQGYTAKVWVAPAVDRDNTPNSEDLREIKVEVWPTGATHPCETARTLLTFGGI